MPHPVVYPGNLDELIKKWEAQRAKDWKERKPLTYIANGQCARLPQALTSAGHTSRWRPGERVVDVAKILKPGTVIANFKMVDGALKYPNEHHYHAAIFVRAEGYSVVTGKPSQIIVFDQWVGATPDLSHAPGTRPIRAWTEELMRARNQRPYPSDNANDFYVVEVP
jgi:hypothetical protein